MTGIWARELARERDAARIATRETPQKMAEEQETRQDVWMTNSRTWMITSCTSMTKRRHLDEHTLGQNACTWMRTHLDKMPEVGWEPHALGWQNACTWDAKSNSPTTWHWLFARCLRFSSLGPVCFLFNIPLHFHLFLNFPVKRNSCALCCCTSSTLVKSKSSNRLHLLLPSFFFTFYFSCWPWGWRRKGRGWGPTIEPHFFFVLLFLSI
jgi:hypothetical protein